MMVFVATLVIFLIAVLAMSVGMMVAGRRLRGSCGGVSGGNCAKCSPAKQAKCQSDEEAIANADVPVPASALRRDANLPAGFANRRIE